ncbi:MAG: cupin domain-containing protein [Chloroflexi bacterium]|nr:cupin domain-containing protein [Chloroflexota bacterium]
MPVSVGNYEVVSHVETPECSLRVIRLGADRKVELHYHERSSQVYFVLAGEVEITINKDPRRLVPQQSARVAPFVPHGVRAADSSALVLSISVPPLSPEDQHPIGH